MAEAKTELGRQDLAVGGDNAFRKDQDYALLRLDRLSLLVPQREIRTLEPAADLDPDIPSRNGVGWVNLGKQRWPVYCFSAELASLTRLPAERRICAVLDAGVQLFGLVVSEVALFARRGIALHSLPQAMALPNSPILGLAVHEHSMACVSSAARLLSLAKGELSASQQ